MAASAPTAEVDQTRRVSRLGADWKLAWPLMLPLLIVVVGLIVYPFSVGIALAFQHKLVGQPGEAAGFSNFTALLFGKQYRSMFWSSVWISLLYTVLSVIAKLILGTAMALALNEKFRGRTFMRSLLFLPWAIPTVVVALTWRWLYDGSEQGLINHVLHTWFGKESLVQFLSDPKLALAAVVLVVVWQGTPFYTMMILSGLQTIPEEQYEAAAIDGAGMVQRFFNVTLPGLRSTILVTTLLSAIWTANSINFVYVLTAGGPLNKTTTFPMLAYNIGLQSKQLGLSAAISVLFLPFFVVAIWALTRRMLSQNRDI